MEHKIGFIEAQSLEPKAYEVSRWLSKLDAVAVDTEARWGIGRLYGLASGDLKARWDRQREAIRKATEALDLETLPSLVDGAIRGWAALEAYALGTGAKPCAPEYLEMKVYDQVYRVVTTNAKAAVLGRECAASGCIVMTLEELLNVYHVRAMKVYEKPVDMGGEAIVRRPFEEDTLIGI